MASCIRATARRVRSEVLGVILLCIAIAASLGVAMARPAHAEDRSTEPNDVTNIRLSNSLLDWTNSVRERHGLRPLRMEGALARYATRHSSRMADRDVLFHSSASEMNDVLTGTGWSQWGENIGMAPSLRRVERSFMQSPEHRDNLLRRAFDHVGVGVIRSGSLTWVTLDLYAT